MSPSDACLYISVVKTFHPQDTPLPGTPPLPAAQNSLDIRTEEGDAFISMGFFREISVSHELPGMEAWKKSLPSPRPFRGRLFFRGVY